MELTKEDINIAISDDSDKEISPQLNRQDFLEDLQHRRIQTHECELASSRPCRNLFFYGGAGASMVMLVEDVTKDFKEQYRQTQEKKKSLRKKMK